MDNTYWHRQGSEPLYPDLLWSRPENRQLAGKLLIIGGNVHGFNAPSAAYQEASKAGVGLTKVLLPDAVKRLAGALLDNVEYAPSTPSGSFSKQALAEWLDWTKWADGVLLAGDLGRNSETAIVCEALTSKTNQAITVTKDAIDNFYNAPEKLLDRPNTTIVLSIAQLQKLCTHASWPEPVVYSMGLLQLVDLLHNLTASKPCNIIVQHLDTVCVAVSGQVSTTKIAATEIWRVPTAAHAAVWWLQNPSNPFQALTTAVHTYFHDLSEYKKS